MKKDFILQHKYPWETEWSNVSISKSEYNDKFNKILKEEPLHLIEIEYRVVKNTHVKLKSTDKVITRPEIVLIGTDMSEKVMKYNEG